MPLSGRGPCPWRGAAPGVAGARAPAHSLGQQPRCLRTPWSRGPDLSSYSFLFLKGLCPGTFLLFSLSLACNGLKSWRSCFLPPRPSALCYWRDRHRLRPWAGVRVVGMEAGCRLSAPPREVALISFHSALLACDRLVSELPSKLDSGTSPPGGGRVRHPGLGPGLPLPSEWSSLCWDFSHGSQYSITLVNDRVYQEEKSI